MSLEEQVAKEEKGTLEGTGQTVMETRPGYEAREQQRNEVEMVAPEGNENLDVHVGPAP